MIAVSYWLTVLVATVLFATGAVPLTLASALIVVVAWLGGVFATLWLVGYSGFFDD